MSKITKDEKEKKKTRKGKTQQRMSRQLKRNPVKRLDFLKNTNRKDDGKRI